jgi:hypothetical protein
LKTAPSDPVPYLLLYHLELAAKRGKAAVSNAAKFRQATAPAASASGASRRRR